MLLETHFPVFARFGQFNRYILALEKQANRLCAHEMLCIPQKLIERRAGAGGDNIEIFFLHRLHPSVFDSRIQFESISNSTQERAFFCDGFEQCDLYPIPQKLRQHQPREACAAS